MNSAVIMPRETVVIGAGPVGLGSAILLQKGGSKVTVLESRSLIFDSSRAYLYLLDGRGQQLTNLLGLTPQIAASAVSSTLFTSLTEVLPASPGLRVKSIPVVKSSIEKFWVPRDVLLETMLTAAREAGVRVLLNTRGEIHMEEGVVSVNCTGPGVDDIEVLRPDLLIGCDGFKSSTRQFLADSNIEGSAGFEPVEQHSDSAGLLYKMLSVRSDFRLPSSGVPSKPETAYAIRGTGTTPTTRLSLGLLPVKSPRRTANIIAKADHEVWTCKTTACLKAFLQRTFPQLKPLEEYFSDEELQRFTETREGSFPVPSSTKRCQAQLGGCTVLLAGDAMHSFPPDLGQGVNSGLEDVFTLHKILSNSSSLAEAAVTYEKARIPESKALVDIMTYGYPYQYGQMPFRGKLAIANFGLRLALSKVIPKVFSPPAFFMIQDHTMPYSEIHKRAMRTTRRLVLMMLTLIGAAIAKFLRFVPIHSRY